MAGGGEVSVRFSSQNEADLFRALLQVAQRVGGIKDALGQTNEVAKKVDPALKRFAESVKSISSTPIQELAAANRRLDEAIKANVLTEQDAAGARAKAQERYRAELRRTREDMAANAKVTIGADGLPQLQEADQVSAVDRYQQRMDELRASLKSGKIEQATFFAAAKAAAQDYTEELKQATAEQTKADAALKKFAQDLAKQDSTPLDRHRERMEKLNAAAQRGVVTQREFEAASKKSNDIMQAELAESQAKLDRLNAKAKETGQAASGSFLQMADSVKLAWAGIAGYVFTILNDINTKAKESADKLRQSAPLTGSIAQISTSQEQFQKLTNEAEKLLALGAAKDFADAQTFIVAMQNAGAMNEVSNFAMLRKFGIMEKPEQMIAAAAGLQTSMGEQATGTKFDLTNMAFVAGGAAPDTAEQVLKAAGKAGVAAKQQGATVEETLAVTAILSKAFASSDIGGDRAKEFFSKLAIAEPKLDARGRVAEDSPLKVSMRGRSLEEVLNDQQLAAMTPAQLQRAFGSEQFAQAYGTLLQAKDEVLALTQATKEGRTQDLMGQKIGYVQGDSRAMAAIFEKEAAGRLELRRQVRGVKEMQAESFIMGAEEGAEDYSQQSQKKRPGLTAGMYGVLPGFRELGAGNLMAKATGAMTTAELSSSVSSLGMRGVKYVSPDAILEFSKLTQTGEKSSEQLRQISDQQARANQILEETKQIMADFNSKISQRPGPAPRVNLAPSARQEQAAAAN